MKLSNRILIGFFGFIFIYMTAAFTEIRFRGDLNNIDESNGIVESVNISGMRYLVIPDLGERINIKGSEKPRIEVRSLSGDLLQNLKYHVSNDTLTLTELNLAEDQYVKLSIYVSNSTFKGMIVNGATVVVEELDQNALSVSQTSGWIRINENNKLGKLHIEASQNANFNLLGANLDTLSVLIDNSEVMILSTIKRIEGSMSNDSYLQLRGADEIEFKKDESSRLRLF